MKVCSSIQDIQTFDKSAHAWTRPEKAPAVPAPSSHYTIYNQWTEFLLDQRDSAGAGWSQIVELWRMRIRLTRAVTPGGTPPSSSCVWGQEMSGPVLSRIVNFDRIPNTEYIPILKMCRILNRFGFVKMTEYEY